MKVLSSAIYLLVTKKQTQQHKGEGERIYGIWLDQKCRETWTPAICQWAVTILFHLIRCTGRFKRPSSSFILLHLPPLSWGHCMFGCLILHRNVFSRRLSNSALSNPSWRSSPSSCRPTANITTVILSELYLLFLFPFHLSCILWVRVIASGLVCCFCAHGNGVQMEIIISPLHSRHVDVFTITMVSFQVEFLRSNLCAGDLLHVISGCITVAAIITAPDQNRFSLVSLLQRVT